MLQFIPQWNNVGTIDFWVLYCRSKELWESIIFYRCMFSFSQANEDGERKKQQVVLMLGTFFIEKDHLTDRMRSDSSHNESPLQDVRPHPHRDRVRSSGIWRELGVEPLHLLIKRSQLIWFGYPIRMPHGCLSGQVFQAWLIRKPRGTPRMAFIPSGVGMSWDPPGRVGRCSYGNVQMYDFVCEWDEIVCVFMNSLHFKERWLLSPMAGLAL